MSSVSDMFSVADKSALITSGRRGIGYAIAAGPFPTKTMEQPLALLGDQLRAAIPVKRVGEPDDIAAAAIFLASRATTYRTAADIPLDGAPVRPSASTSDLAPPRRKEQQR